MWTGDAMKTLKITLAMLILVLANTCSKPPEADQTGTTTVVVVGGLGGSQLNTIIVELQKLCPNAKIIDAGQRDAYDENIYQILAQNPSNKIVLIGHSFGGETVFRACFGAKVNYLAMIDPVRNPWGNLPAVSSDVDKYDYFVRSRLFGPYVARIEGAAPIVISGGHNEIPHDPLVINRIAAQINELDSVE
jgi:hypothetical protein